MARAWPANYDFSLFEYWSTDYAGHKQDMSWAVRQLEMLDSVLAGLLRAVDADQLILMSSDHGNMEDLSTRRHTAAPVPALIIGNQRARRSFASGLTDLTGIAPGIERLVCDWASAFRNAGLKSPWRQRILRCPAIRSTCDGSLSGARSTPARCSDGRLVAARSVRIR